MCYRATARAGYSESPTYACEAEEARS